MQEWGQYIDLESGRRRRGGWRRSRRRTLGTRLGLVRCQHLWLLIHQQAPWQGRWEVWGGHRDEDCCPRTGWQSSETSGQARTSKEQRLWERRLFPVQNNWTGNVKRTAVDTESGVRHAIVKDGYDGETGLNCYTRGQKPTLCLWIQDLQRSSLADIPACPRAGNQPWQA